MDARQKHNNEDSGHQNSKTGVSSFSRTNPEKIFAALAIKPGQHILDLGCGAGDYSMRAAKETGPSGKVTALDRWPDPVEALNNKASAEGLKNLNAKAADILSPLDIEEESVDLCFLFTVLHGLDLKTQVPALAREILRVLKPTGRFAVLEMKKEETPFGPPLEIRLSEKETEELFAGLGFKELSVTDLGYTYLSVFGKA